MVSINSDHEEIKKLLIEQICSTVKWRESLINISNSGVSNFIEIGNKHVIFGKKRRRMSKLTGDMT